MMAPDVIPRTNQKQSAKGYPPRFPVEESQAAWDLPFPEYDPPEYTAVQVFEHEGEWADPADVKLVNRPFVTQTARGEVPVIVDEGGRPLNPLGRTGIRGRGLLGKWGRNLAGDPLVTSVNPETGRLQVLVIERGDSGRYALPGGMVDEGEAISETIARELREETGVDLSFQSSKVLYSGIVDDPRNTDHAWMETTVLHQHLSPAARAGLRLRAGDDARAVRWADVGELLLGSMHANHQDFVRMAMQELGQTAPPD
ncbi:ADP-ribose pyrophosphatase [Schlesneria sp. DSM 10557]|uniref:ADP-ribose pyrophosphatase n=1 Tax=Schlesneria sp. DSM 10557 TaxID=3044399 RepID=UPI0035A0E3A7